MKKYESISERVKNDIERSKSIDSKFAKKEMIRRNIVVALGLVVSLIQILIAISGGKFSTIGILLLITSGIIISHVINCHRYSIVTSMATYFLINTTTLFILYFINLLNVHEAIFFGMILFGLIGMSLFGIVGFINQIEDS